ncbi:unnamed protein product [Rotaria socialis]|uniref:Uncharacterized protein n=1 Tax=Rotaria socialis TaxID=392032 RepID=A0A818H289_9BILA|nr:unnamed protein product [Rotaria socialis]CAF3499556.1 unnamed protein product [Rotaria socialis]CAF3711442.1 unnamed protein product [Rotaria socialis]CAF4298369.1 unnamed protein product [Rotaria socialis]CAF4428404.1 unnamed protein product [Rotaria socialis]
MNSTNNIKFNARIKSQQKILIILLFIAMGMGVLCFFATHIEVASRLQTIDGKVKEIFDILDEIDLALVIECLSLFFVIKLDRLGILIFAWIEVNYLILMTVSIVFMGVIYVDESSTSDNDPKETQSAVANSIYIVIMIAGVITIIVSILKITFMFKLAKSLKQRTQEDAQQQYPLI